MGSQSDYQYLSRHEKTCKTASNTGSICLELVDIPWEIITLKLIVGTTLKVWIKHVLHYIVAEVHYYTHLAQK